MAIINLRDYYPFYTSDCFMEVSEEVAEMFKEFDRKEAAYRLRTYRHKAYYSLDRDDGLEHEAVFVALSPHELYERKVTMEDCLFASELEPLPPLARLRRASTRTKPFILILMTIWPKPNHYVRTVGRLISALCVTPPALIKAASTSRKNRLRVKIVVHIHI